MRGHITELVLDCTLDLLVLDCTLAIDLITCKADF